MSDFETLTPEQQAEVNEAFKGALELATELVKVMEGKPSAVQAGGAVFIMAAIVCSDIEAGRFKDEHEALAHYIEGVHAVIEDRLGAEARAKADARADIIQ